MLATMFQLIARLVTTVKLVNVCAPLASLGVQLKRLASPFLLAAPHGTTVDLV